MREREDGDLLNSRLRAARTGHLLVRASEQGGRLASMTCGRSCATTRTDPKSVCKHVAPGVNEHVCTIGSVIVDLTAGELHVCAGNPCEGE